MKPDLEKTLLNFSLLVTQSELYGYALKGNVNAQFEHKLKKYLATADDLLKFINRYVDADTLEDESEQIAIFIENLTNKK
jgi:hypothetical protein